jgi:hypothetical protein
MLNFNRKNFVRPEMSQYIKEQIISTQNKLMEKYSNKNNDLINDKFSNLVNYKNIKPNLSNSKIILPFVSLLSFLAGYNFHYFIYKIFKRD